MKREALLFLLNGSLATIVHFSILIFLVDYLGISNISLSNIIAGIAGVTCSFLGNKYIVFNVTKSNTYFQALKFLILYIGMIFFHTLILKLSINLYGMDYRFSFVIASLSVLMISFLSNKFMIFK